MEKPGNGRTASKPNRQPIESEQDASKAGIIDWDIVHQQVLDSTARLAWMDDLPQDELEKTWARRAAQIAREIEAEEPDEQVELALFKLGNEEYAVEVQYIIDLRLADHVTRVPRVPEWVAGVINIRGRIMSAVDLKRYLGFYFSARATNHDAPASQLVVVETQEMEVALLVDEVIAIETMPVSRIQEANSAVRGIPPEYMRGIIVRPNQSLLVILNLRALLSDSKMIIHEEIL